MWWFIVWRRWEGGCENHSGVICSTWGLSVSRLICFGSMATVLVHVAS